MEKSELSYSGSVAGRAGTLFNEQYTNFLQSTLGEISPYRLQTTFPSRSTFPFLQ
jgi:hypothetical protein